MTYRVGNHQPQNVYRDDTYIGVMFSPETAAEVVVTMNGQASALENATGAELLAELRRRGELDDDADGVTLLARVAALRAELDTYTLEARRSDYVPDDSCTCGLAGSDPACLVHEGRKARGPKPPPLGPGCICDGSGRTCPRHGVVT
jgi:hypothetical protein